MRYSNPHLSRLGCDMRDTPFKCSICANLGFATEKGLKIHQASETHKWMVSISIQTDEGVDK